MKNEINEDVLNNFTEENGFDVTVMIGQEFCYYVDCAVIDFALYTGDFADQCYQEYIHSLCPELQIDTGLISFFHELGHHVIGDKYSTKEYCLFAQQKDSITGRFIEAGEEISDLNRRTLYMEYFDIQEEREATMWAIEYVLANLPEKEREDLVKAIEDILEASNATQEPAHTPEPTPTPDSEGT